MTRDTRRLNLIKIESVTSFLLPSFSFSKEKRGEVFFMSKKIRSNKIRTILFILSVLIFIVSAGMLIKLLIIDPNINNSNIEEISDIYYNVDEDQDHGDLMSLRGINEDIKGWIKIKDTKIDYPVLQSDETNSTYYLYRNYKKESSGFGSIFIDSQCDTLKPSKNMILYGHNMRDKSMFGTLLKYDDLDFYKERPVIIFDTLYEQGYWKIISIFKTNTLKEQGEIFNPFRIDFASNKDFLKFVYDVKIRSLIDTPVNISIDDRLILLSTCSYELKDFRTIIVARKVRQDESIEVEVEKATRNYNPLMPEGYYKKYGGTPPIIAGFETDFKNGKLNWLI